MDVESQEVVANADAVELAEVKAEAHDGTVRVHMKAKLHLTRLTILKPCFLLVNLNILGRPVMRKLHFWWWCRGCRYNYKYYKHGSVRTIGKKLCPCQKCTCRHGTWYCKNQRRSVEDLSTLERGIYVAALIHLKNEGRTPGLPQDLTTPTIMQFFNHHGTFGGDAHWNPHFLPWHREYLRHLEAEMMESWREIQSSAALRTWAIDLFAEQGITISASDITNNCVALPYWAWEHDSGLVANTRKFSETSTFGGGGGGSGNNHCVMDGMAGWTADLNTYDWRIVGDCLKRSYSMGGTVNTYDLTDWANHLTINGYCSFANSAEAGIHYAPHTYVQQTMGSVPTAGREFLFYLHHNNIDRLWHEWQQYSPANTYDYSDCGSSKGLHSPMPPFDGTTYPEATPDDVISHKMWKHTCKPPVYGPIIAWPAHLTVAAAWPVLWSVSLRTSRTCYGAEWVPHGKKCSLIGSGGVLTWNITVALAKIFEAGLGGKIPSAGKLQSAAKLDEMFNPAAWRAFGFNEEQTQHLRNARSASKLSSADKLRWAPFFKEDSRRELFGGMPEEWISEGGLDALLQEARKLHADTCSSDFRADSFFDITV